MLLAAAGCAMLICPVLIQGALDVFVPGFLADFSAWISGPLDLLANGYILAQGRHRWPPAHWCYVMGREGELYVLHDLHHLGISGRGTTVEDAARDARHHYYRGTFL